MRPLFDLRRPLTGEQEFALLESELGLGKVPAQGIEIRPHAQNVGTGIRAPRRAPVGFGSQIKGSVGTADVAGGVVPGPYHRDRGFSANQAGSDFGLLDELAGTPPAAEKPGFFLLRRKLAASRGQQAFGAHKVFWKVLLGSVRPRLVEQPGNGRHPFVGRPGARQAEA